MCPFISSIIMNISTIPTGQREEEREREGRILIKTFNRLIEMITHSSSHSLIQVWISSTVESSPLLKWERFLHSPLLFSGVLFSYHRFKNVMWGAEDHLKEKRCIKSKRGDAGIKNWSSKNSWNYMIIHHSPFTSFKICRLQLFTSSHLLLFFG